MIISKIMAHDLVKICQIMGHNFWGLKRQKTPAKLVEEGAFSQKCVVLELERACYNGMERESMEYFSQPRERNPATAQVQKSPPQPHLHAVWAPLRRSFSPTFTHWSPKAL